VSAFLFVVLSCVGRGLAWGRSPIQGVLPIVYRFTSRNPSTPQGKRGRLRNKEICCILKIITASFYKSLVLHFQNKWDVAEKREQDCTLVSCPTYIYIWFNFLIK
jgi:hypothetical protein